MKYIILTALLFGFTVCNAEYLVTAKWTGRSKPVYSVNNRNMLTCEYAYSQERVWRAFENHCEPLIIIERKQP